MPLTRNTDWRHLGAVPYPVWKNRILDAGGLPAFAERNVWEALGDDSALALAQLEAESSYASDFDHIPAWMDDPWNLQIDGEGIEFDTAVEAAQAWRNRLYDPTYKDGVYTKTKTIFDMVSRYAPREDGNDPEGYTDGLIAEMQRNGFDTGGKPVALRVKQWWLPTTNRNFPGLFLDNVAELWITIHETDNTDVGAGAQMHAEFVFNGGGSDTVSFHLTVDSIEAYQMMVLDQVAWHAGDGCDDDGSVDVGCKRSVAIETCVNADGDWRQTKLNLIELCVMIIRGDAKLSFGRAKGKFSPFRIGQHNKWSGKNCPRRIRAEGSWGAITGAIQSGAGGTPPVVTPPTTIELIFDGLDIEVAKRLFGTVKGEDGATYKFDANGPVSKAWVARGEETGNWPALKEVWVYADGRRYFRFDDGWTVIDPPGPNTPPKALKP